MTLLLTLATPAGIHQSSDYRLTRSTGMPIEDAAGAKQLEVRELNWSANISFTGIAYANSYRTRDVIARAVTQRKQPEDINAFIAGLTTLFTNALRQPPASHASERRLTILVAVVAPEGTPRVFLISNFDRLNGPQLKAPLDHLEAFTLDVTSPRALIFGYADAVPPGDRKLLKALSRDTRPPAELQALLAEVNHRAARNSRHLISPGCMTSSLMRDGAFSSRNVGEVPGMIDNFMGSTNLADIVKGRYEGLVGSKPTVVQSFGVVGGGTPAPTEIGEPRAIKFSSPTSIMRIGDDTGPQFAKLVIDGLSGTVLIRKNSWVTTVLNTVSFEIDPTSKPLLGPLTFEWLELANIPTVDGAQPKTWNYLFDVRIERGKYTIMIRQNSLAFRSANYKVPLQSLGPTEELVMVAPFDGLTLTASPDLPRVAAQIEARFFLRDFPELNR